MHLYWRELLAIQQFVFLIFFVNHQKISLKFHEITVCDLQNINYKFINFIEFVRIL